MSEDIKNMSEDQEPESYDVLLRNGVKPNDLYNNGKPTKMDCPNFRLELLQSEYLRLRRYLYGLTAVVVTGILILIIVVAVLFGKLSHDLINHEHKPKVGEQISAMLKNNELCVPCMNIRSGPSAEENEILDKFARKFEENVEMCCVETPSELLLMLELVSLVKISLSLYLCFCRRQSLSLSVSFFFSSCLFRHQLSLSLSLCFGRCKLSLTHTHLISFLINMYLSFWYTSALRLRYVALAVCGILSRRSKISAILLDIHTGEKSDMKYVYLTSV